MNLDLSAEQLRRAADLKEQIEELQSQLSALLGSPDPGSSRHISFEARARMAAVARARWARFHANGEGGPAHRRRRKMSTAAKARLAAIARARWRKVKAAGKNSL
jgi:hypothetical protein